MVKLLRKYLVFILFLFTSSSIIAQVKSFEGKVVDDDRNPVVNYHVILLDTTGSTILSAKSFNTEAFSMERPSIACLVKISRIGYKEVIIPLAGGESSGKFDLGVIILPFTAYTLDEVTVSAKNPFLIMQHDKLVYNVENTTISNAGNAIDLLKRTPYIVAGANNEITVAGRGKTLILIDGRRTRSNEELRLINSSRVKQVEVIENPGAKYEAEGHAVINIVLHKGQGEGLQGSVYLRYLQGKRGSFFISPELSYQTSKMQLFGTVGLDMARRGWNEKMWMRYEKENYLFQSSSHDRYAFSKGTNFTYSFGMDYRISTAHTLGLFLDGYTNRIKNNTIRDLIINKNDLPQFTLLTDQRRKEMPDRNSVGLNYLYKDKKGLEVSFMGDMTLYRTGYKSDINETNLNSGNGNKIKNNSDSDYDLYSAKLDINLPLGEHAGNLELGGKYSHIKSDNDNLFKRFESGEWIDDSLFSNYVEYTEQILGAYVSWNKKVNKWRFTAGLRVENSWTINNSTGSTTSEYKDNDFQFFPNVSVNYTKNKKYSYRMGFTRRITRPSYASLNNTLIYIDSLSSREGNPYLKPTIYNTVSANMLLLQKINIGLSYSYLESPQDMLFINDPVNIENYTIMFQNVKDSWSVALNIAGNFKYKAWTTQPFFSFSYSPVRIVDDGQEYIFKNPMYSLNWVNQVDLGKNWSLDADLLFEQPAYSFKKFGKKLNLNLGCTKKLFENRMVLSASVKNEYLPFTQTHQYSYKYGKVEYEGNSRYSVMLSLRYYLRDIKSSVKKKKSSSEDELRRL